MTNRQLRRALGPEQKTERRAAILRAAEALLRRAPSGEFSVAELARRAKLAKGTVYLYFRSREEVLLAVHQARLDRMFDFLETALAAPGGGAASAASATLGFLHGNPAFLPLAVNCRGMIEANVGTDAALAFKTAVAERLGRIGARVEALYPGRLAPGEGFALLMNSYALILGLWQLSDQPACLKQSLENPALQCFRIDYEKQLEAALLALWNGATTGRGGIQ